MVPLIDTTRQIEVPEGIELSLPVAGLVSRALAFSIDLVIRWVAIWIIAIVVQVLGNLGTGLVLIFAFLAEWFYPVIFEVFNQGQTPGKKSMGLMVVKDDGSPISWSPSIVRNLLRFADFLPVFYGVAIISMLFSCDFKRLGDYAAGTLVVHSRPKLLDPPKLEIDPLAPKSALSLEEQSAIIAFAERSNRMSPARISELASHLAPWLDQQKIKDNSQPAFVQLYRIAKWLRGHG